MKGLSDFNQLRRIADDLTMVSQSSPGVAYLFDKKIKDFFDKNLANIRRMTQFHDKLVVKYVEFDTVDGEVKPRVDEKANYIFTSEEASKQYSDEYDQFFNQKIMIL